MAKAETTTHKESGNIMGNQKNQYQADYLVKSLASELALGAIEGTNKLGDFLYPRIVHVEETFGYGKSSNPKIQGYELKVNYRSEEIFIEQKSDTAFAKITSYCMDTLGEDEATGTLKLGENLSEILWNYVIKNWRKPA